jgi:hypothetical protein
MRKTIMCVRCEKEGWHGGHGLCKKCYMKEYERPIPKKRAICIDCGEEKLHQGRGRCRSCYSKWYRLQPGWKKRHASNMRKARKERPEVYRAIENRRRATHGRKKWKRAYHQQYYASNRERLLIYQSEYRRADPERRDNYKRRRRARIRGLEDTLTVQEWHQILEEHRHSCAYCGVSGVALEREHKIPSVMGGGYTAENIVPACGPCNRRKQTMTDTEFREYLKKYPR